MKYAKVAVESTVLSFDKEFDYIVPEDIDVENLIQKDLVKEY